MYPLEIKYSAARSSPVFPNWLCCAISTNLEKRIYEDSMKKEIGVRKMELDIVAYRDKTLVVVEVKTRKNNEFLRPEEAVTLRKIKNIIQATDAYIRMFDIPFDIRFDIITLVGENEDFQIEHIEDAFLPPLNCR